MKSQVWLESGVRECSRSTSYYPLITGLQQQDGVFQPINQSASGNTRTERNFCCIILCINDTVRRKYHKLWCFAVSNSNINTGHPGFHLHDSVHLRYFYDKNLHEYSWDHVRKIYLKILPVCCLYLVMTASTRRHRHVYAGFHLITMDHNTGKLDSLLSVIINSKILRNFTQQYGKLCLVKYTRYFFILIAPLRQYSYHRVKWCTLNLTQTVLRSIDPVSSRFLFASLVST